jgi:hypothetical protein
VARPGSSSRAERPCSLVIDNYDSFTFNLVQYFGELGEDVSVFRNDEIDVEGIAAAPGRARARLGPCTPAEAGVCVEARLRAFAGKRRSSASASATRRSAPRSAAGWCAPAG